MRDLLRPLEYDGRMSQEMGNARLASVLERFAGPAKGFAELAIRRRESELGRPFPPAVRYLYQHCTPHRWAATIKESIRLLPLEEIQWLAEESAFIFAAGMYGDAIFQQCGGSSGDDGAIVLADHECTDGEFVILGENLAAWIERLLAFDGVEYAYLQGELPNLPLERQRALIDEYQRLNPRSEWAARERLRLDHPGGHPQGDFHWDPPSGRLVPIAQAGDITDITLKNPTSADLESIASAGRCKSLTL
jgi:hypothetical protein